jgi:UDP-galactopyranose mutase
MSRRAKIAVVGAGFSGAVIAQQLADSGHEIFVFDSRDHIAGNCHTDRDPDTGVLVHVYGPHIFHTDDERVWKYVTTFAEFVPFINRVKAIANGRIYSLPINLLTINQFFNKTLRPAEARAFVESLTDPSIVEPHTFEEQALRFVGRDLYEAFFQGYTRKQWGLEPSELPASILKRLPLRFNYDDNYYAHRYQGIPRHGYTALIESMIDRPRISVELGCVFEPDQCEGFDHVFYSGPVDRWFRYSHGALGYRTLDFEIFRDLGDYQGTAVINYCDQAVPFTRITEHKHFSPWESHERTLCYREFSRPCQTGDTPYYPIRLAQEKAQLLQYVSRAKQGKGVTFVGRLGTYRYLDMDVTIREALDAASLFLQCQRSGEAMPTFAVSPFSRSD